MKSFKTRTNSNSLYGFMANVKSVRVVFKKENGENNIYLLTCGCHGLNMIYDKLKLTN